MSARDTILASMRTSLGVTGQEPARLAAVTARLHEPARGPVPARGQLPADERLALFHKMVAAAAGSSTQVAAAVDVPAAIAAVLRRHNLPMRIRRGSDARWQACAFEREPALEIATGPSAGNDLAAASYAFGGVAESGTLMLLSGPDNPTTLNFLPDLHVIVVAAEDIAGDYEALWTKLRAGIGDAGLPRSVNWITGPSRSADIQQTLILGAHGPRHLHVIVIG